MLCNGQILVLKTLVGYPIVNKISKLELFMNVANIPQGGEVCPRAEISRKYKLQVWIIG